MSGQPREVCEAVLAGAGTGGSKIESLPKMTFEAWADSVPGYRDDAYLKSITIEPTKSGTLSEPERCARLNAHMTRSR